MTPTGHLSESHRRNRDDRALGVPRTRTRQDQWQKEFRPCDEIHPSAGFVIGGWCPHII